MTIIHADRALLPEGWRFNVRLGIANGLIAAIEPDAAFVAGSERHAIVVAGMPNLHSHAFQRGMAGLAELRGQTADSFWSWRDTMYRLALTLSPDDVEAIAGQLYVEMLEAGFCRVGEFHYLHHDVDGQAYGDIGEMAQRIAAAAQETGIGLTLLPVFYARAGFGGLPPATGQRRFISTQEGYAQLFEGCRAAISSVEGAVLGVAPHSLRAVTPEELSFAVKLAGDAPIHIHIAEQVKEVEDCVAWSGARPVEWLLDHAPVNDKWCLIHATHMTAAETSGMAQRGAIAGLCPITEANLGDGIFNGPDFMAQGGRFGIGSDSNVQIGVGDELRQFEYSQRLAHRARNVMAAAGGSTGRALFDGAVSGGGAALGVKSGLRVGASADFVSLKTDDVALAGQAGQGDFALDSWIFVAGNRLVDCVWVRGQQLVKNGTHKNRETLAKRFKNVMLKLASG